MLGESEKPLMFFGETVEGEEKEIERLEISEDSEALEFLNFLRLYAAIFFNDFELAEKCLAKLSDEVDGIWIPWYVSGLDLRFSGGICRANLIVPFPMVSFAGCFSSNVSLPYPNFPPKRDRDEKSFLRVSRIS
jgi:hypothetical protein